MKALITGFEPFGRWQRNPSGETARHLDGATIVDLEVSGLVLPVGGASGPLFGTLFMALGKELPAAPDRSGLTAAFGKAIEAVAARGKSQPGQKTNDIAGDLGVNYKLTKDGRYLINAYRRDQYIVLQGEVVETGIGFTMTVEYNRFKEIFAKMSKREKELQKQYKQKEKEKKKADKLEKQQADKEQEEKDRDSTTVHTT